jgi:hypothetical protein
LRGSESWPDRHRPSPPPIRPPTGRLAAPLKRVPRSLAYARMIHIERSGLISVRAA